MDKREYDDDTTSYLNEKCIACKHYYHDGIHYDGEPICTEHQVSILEGPVDECIDDFLEQKEIEDAERELNEQIEFQAELEGIQ